MNEFALDMYRQMFLSLRRGMSKGNLSSAKPIFILSLIESVQYFKTNCFNVTNEFLKQYYYKNIKTFAPTSKTPLVIPFFHIHTEPFYEILWKDDKRPKNYPHTPSIKQLNNFSSGAKLDDELWELLQDETNRQYLRESIINHYFMPANSSFSNN